MSVLQYYLYYRHCGNDHIGYKITVSINYLIFNYTVAFRYRQLLLGCRFVVHTTYYDYSFPTNITLRPIIQFPGHIYNNFDGTFTLHICYCQLGGLVGHHYSTMVSICI